MKSESNDLNQTIDEPITAVSIDSKKHQPAGLYLHGYGDFIFANLLRLFALALVLMLAAIGFFLYHAARPSIAASGLNFFIENDWDPIKERFGIPAVLYGTLVSSFIAIMLASPLSIGVALFITQIAPRSISTLLSSLVEMLAIIPSVVYGLWGIFVLAPWLRETVEPFLGHYLGFIPLFQGPISGVGMLTAGLILAIMITPTISSILREVFLAVPAAHKESALALGFTRWEMMSYAILKSCKKGIAGAVILGMGRALGETMAVTMVIGNKNEISASLFAPATTMASIIANEYSEATDDIHLAALIEVGLILLAVTFIINTLARLLIFRNQSRSHNK